MPAKAPSIFHYYTIGSTNDEAQRLASQIDPPLFVFAAKQTAGRGRQGRTWFSPEGNLYCTAAFAAALPLAQLPLFTLFAALRLCSALRQKTKANLWLKWPNDLWIGNKKCAGLLAESPVVPKKGRQILLGVGLNVNTRDFPPEVKKTATSLKEATRKKWPLEDLEKVFCQTLMQAYEDFVDTNFSRELMSLWKEHDRLTDHVIRFDENGKTFEGTVLGITPEGALKVKTATKTHELRSGEVTLSRHLR